MSAPTTRGTAPRRGLAIAVLAVITVIALVGCGGEEASWSPPVTENTVARLPLSRQGQGIAPETLPPTSEVPEVTTGETDTPETTEEPADPLDPIESLGDCVSITASIASLMTLAVGGEDGADRTAAKAAELKAVTPPTLHDDIDVMAGTIAAVAREGMVDGSDRLQDPTYRAAEETVAEWVGSGCGL